MHYCDNLLQRKYFCPAIALSEHEENLHLITPRAIGPQSDLLPRESYCTWIALNGHEAKLHFITLRAITLHGLARKFYELTQLKAKRIEEETRKYLIGSPGGKFYRPFVEGLSAAIEPPTSSKIRKLVKIPTRNIRNQTNSLKKLRIFNCCFHR